MWSIELYTVGILTISTSGSSGNRVDKSGPTLRDMISSEDFNVTLEKIIPDDFELITATLINWSELTNLILTTGGTGFGKDDVTPEATEKILDRKSIGLSELMRRETYKFSPMSSLSRGISGTLGSCLIINLPGSPQGAKESLSVIQNLIPHILETMSQQIENHTN
ncbi:MAG: molybdenum cofactor biosynthesis protein [Chloroflexi bacterium]|nr:molybdenum cofactor biosynthesis protein [Chloroflexota bacterium]